MSCTPNYPSSFPVECITSFLGILKSGNLSGSAQQLVAAAYQVEGYLLSIYPGSPAATSQPITAEQKAQLREAQTLLIEQINSGELSAAQPVGSQLSVLIHSVLVPYLKSLLEIVLANLN